MDVLEADLLAIAHEEGDSLIRVRRSRIAQHKDGSTDPAEINFFSCPVDPTRDTVPEQLTIDFPQFQWIIEVLCRENLADMSMGEFARLVLLDKAVDLKVEDQAPEAFRNLQNSSAHHHHHDRHHKRSHAQPPKVAATLLSGDLWAELVSEDALTRPRRHGLRGASSTQFSSTVQSKSSASRASDSVTAADHTLKPELNLDNPNLIQMRLGVASMLKSANVQSQVHIPYGPDDRSEGATASLPATASKPGDEKKSSVASNSRAAGGNLMTAQQRLNARMQKYEAARSARQVARRRERRVLLRACSESRCSNARAHPCHYCKYKHAVRIPVQIHARRCSSPKRAGRRQWCATSRSRQGRCTSSSSPPQCSSTQIGRFAAMTRQHRSPQARL